MSFAERLARILEKSNESQWSGFYPNIHMRLKVALTILNRNLSSFWNKPADEVALLIENFPAIKAQFDIHDDITLAFAIRTLRMQGEGA